LSARQVASRRLNGDGAVVMLASAHAPVSALTSAVVETARTVAACVVGRKTS
jgi:hypothetical protein